MVAGKVVVVVVGIMWIVEILIVVRRLRGISRGKGMGDEDVEGMVVETGMVVEDVLLDLPMTHDMTIDDVPIRETDLHHTTTVLDLNLPMKMDIPSRIMDGNQDPIGVSFRKKIISKTLAHAGEQDYQDSFIERGK